MWQSHSQPKEHASHDHGACARVLLPDTLQHDLLRMHACACAHQVGVGAGAASATNTVNLSHPHGESVCMAHSPSRATQRKRCSGVHACAAARTQWGGAACTCAQSRACARCGNLCSGGRATASICLLGMEAAALPVGLALRQVDLLPSSQVKGCCLAGKRCVLSPRCQACPPSTRPVDTTRCVLTPRC